MSSLQEFKTSAEVLQHLDALSPSTLGVLCFYTSWARQCEPVRELLSTFAQQIAPEDPPRASFLMVEAESMPDVSKKYGVRSVPWTVLLRGKEEVAKVHGGRGDEVKAALDRALKERDEEAKQKANAAALPPKLEVNPRELPPGAGAPSNGPISSLTTGSASTTADPTPTSTAEPTAPAADAAAPPAKSFSAYAPSDADPATAPQMSSTGMAAETGAKSDEDALNERLAGLVKAAPVMLFMKGTPSAPQCGFSRQLVSILREHGVKYGFFNILADEDVRQGLKKWADWPTYPQLWMSGDLVGGIDIVSSCFILAREGKQDKASVLMYRFSSTHRSRTRWKRMQSSSKHTRSGKIRVAWQRPRRRSSHKWLRVDEVSLLQVRSLRSHTLDLLCINMASMKRMKGG